MPPATLRRACPAGSRKDTKPVCRKGSPVRCRLRREPQDRSSGSLWRNRLRRRKQLCRSRSPKESRPGRQIRPAGFPLAAYHFLLDVAITQAFNKAVSHALAVIGPLAIRKLPDDDFTLLGQVDFRRRAAVLHLAHLLVVLHRIEAVA